MGEAPPFAWNATDLHSPTPDASHALLTIITHIEHAVLKLTTKTHLMTSSPTQLPDLSPIHATPQDPAN